MGGQAEQSSTAASPPASAPSSSAPATTVAGAAPGEGASIDAVISWVEAGRPADPGAHHEAYRDGTATRLGDDIAFTAASGAPDDSTQCITDAAFNSGALTCLVDLTAPAAPPPGAEGMWKAGWVEYAGATLQVGSLRGDPGPFVKGAGPRLADGDSLAFGDNRCRSDVSGLLCVNYAHRSAVRISAGGVAPFGCLRPVAPPPDAVGAAYSC